MSNNNPTIYYKFYKLLKFLYQTVENFEKQYKYNLGEEVLNLTWQCLDLVIKANALPNKEKHSQIKQLSITFDQLKVRLRMAQELGQLSKDQYSHLQTNHIKETGQELNKWLNWAKEK